MTRTEIFANELNMIHDTCLRGFAEYLLNNADEYFFHIAASTSGKYHPEFDLGEGGLVRHTKLVTFIANCMAITHQFDELNSDIVTIAALVHDIKKCGDGNTEHTVKNHPELAYKYIQEKAKEYFPDKTYEEYRASINMIMYTVLSHMGQWGNTPACTTHQFIVHDADFIASRKDFTGFNFK